jgi:hypothetical protein
MFGICIYNSKCSSVPLPVTFCVSETNNGYQ